MLCEKILGNLKDGGYDGRRVDTVSIPWDQAFSRIHRGTTAGGTDIGIRLDNAVLKRGLWPGDVLADDGRTVIAVDIPPCRAIVARVAADHPHIAAKVCYEVGNRHATLFWGESPGTYITPYTEPLYKLLAGLHGVTAEVEDVSLDLSRAISSSSGAHSHDHHH